MINTGPSRECTHFIRSRKQGEFRKLYPLVRLGKVLSKEMTVRSVGFGMGPTVRVDFGESDKYRMCDGIGKQQPLTARIDRMPRYILIQRGKKQ